MELISSIIYFFTPYTDAHEQAVGRFFKHLNENDSRPHTRAKVEPLLQRDIAAINLWTEYRYKGYRYLRKSHRKQLYYNLRLIADDFDRFYRSGAQPADAIMAHLNELAPQAAVDPERALLLLALTNYFSPGRGVYEYHKSSSFGRLLRDPAHEKLVGDCNQIVTLYIYLYSRYYDVSDLQIRMLPGHVALYYNGVDIEATNGTFTDYSGRKDGTLLPIEEIISINLLDMNDSYLSTHEVAAEDLLQASRFAFVLSHDRDLVTSNLETAYGAAINSLMKRNNYHKALEFALASHDTTFLDIVGHNGAAYEIQHRNYAAARRYAQHTTERDELTRLSWRSEGLDHYREHRYHNAIKAFEHAGDQTLVQQCYQALFFEEQEKLGSNLTHASIKEHASGIKRMRVYAKKSGNKQLTSYTDNLNKYL